MTTQASLPDGWQPSGDTLAGRVILVTGATGGLGAAVARSATAAGATAVLVGKRTRQLEKLYDELVATGGPQPAIVPLNLETATPHDYAELAGTLQRELGRIDGIVHAAAFFEGLTPLALHKPDEWLRVLQVNLSAPFALTQAFLPALQGAGDSAVVFVTDDPERLGRAHWGAYGVSKAGLERMASILHEETEGTPLRVHTVLPGPMRTGLRRMAWFGEDTMAQPTPEATALAIVYLLSAQGVAARGATLDLRPGV